MLEVNFVAVAVAGATFLFGGLWYAPFLFGRAWGREAGVLGPNEAPREGARRGKHPAQVFGFALLFSVLGAWALAILLGPHPTVASGVRTGALVGLGVAATSFGVNYQFAARSWAMWAIDAGYHAVQFTLFGLVLGLFG
jgi:hypothetical protein